MRGQEDDHVVSTLRNKRFQSACWPLSSGAARRPSRMRLEERQSRSLFGVSRLNLFPFQARTIGSNYNHKKQKQMIQ